MRMRYATVVVDDAPCHNRMNVEFDGLMEIKYLPPYSCFLNPIEGCFSVFKAFLKNHINHITNQCTPAAAATAGVSLVQHRQNKLMEAVEETINRAISLQVVQANYRHSNSFLMKCVRREDIFH